MDKLVLSFIAIWTVAWCGAHASIVRSKREVSVQIGRSVYIHPDDLVLDGGTTCKVELDVFDPISQRVGTLEPKAFDCRFQPKSVKYIHNGSPLLTKDSIKLRVHKFSNRETVTEIVYLKINILNEAYDVFVIGNPTPLSVPTFSGYSNAIDASILRFRYDMRNNATCMVGFSHYGTNYPLVGQVVMGQDNTPIDALWRECHEFLFLGLQYQHLVPPTPDMDYIPLKVQVNDPLKGIIIERLYLPIIITGAFPNVPPNAAFMKAYLMDVDQFVLTIVSPNIMGAEDDETPEPQLIYNISRPLGPGEGYLVNLADHTRPITSFLQADLSNLNIAYQPPNISYTDRTDFIIEFTVYDSHFARSSQPIVLHISVRPSETKAPRVALNAGLTLIEGHSATIRPNNLQVVDKDNIDRVHCLVKAGLLHGDILVNGRKQMSFSPRDIELGHVVYYHDDTDTTRDQVLLRISDGLHSIQTTLFIHIIPKDDSPPTLVNNIDLDVAQGELVQFKEQKLSAHDSDSNDYDIVYKITSAPAFGEIKRKISSDSPGHIASKFTEEELMKGFIYYKQSKDTDSLTDTFRFTLLDQNQPPNESGEYLTMIHIHPKKNFPPRKIQNTEGSIVTKESDVVFIDKYHLGFEDPDSKDEEIVYSITAQPYFVDSQETLDAGRIINTKNLSMVMKTPGIPGISSFTQAEINYMKIAYMPPMKDIGTDPRLLRFHYTVSDLSGNILTGLTFQITLMPVNDQIPQLMINPLSVKEGEPVALTTNEIFVMDVDTKMEDLVLTFDVMPSRGLLKKDGVVMAVGDRFSVSDLKRRKISYYHDGSDDSAEDSFGVTVSDGMFRLSKAIPIHILLIDDQLPYLTDDSSSQLVVTEGGETFITPAVLSAEDKDTPASKITYIIVQPPTKGSILKGRQNINRFTQQEVNENQIKYMHRSGEIGYNSITDAFKFIIADKVLTSMQDVSIYQLNVTVLPVNDRAPKIVLGNPLIVKEGGMSPITFDILGAQDVDSKSEELTFLIVKQPEWGFVENTRPNPGSEKSNAGISIQKFTIKDLQEGKINYVQANHNKVEPLTDQLVIKVTDGELFSRETLLTINIIPQNDETPVIEMMDIVVEEGHEMSIDDKIMTISDMDEPADRLMVSVVREPDYGKIKMMIERKMRGGEEMVEIPMHDFAARDMQKDMRLYYKHDGSESSDDQFTIEVSDGSHTVRKTAKVHIKRMNDESPEVIKNAGLRILYGEAAFVSSAILKAWDIDNGPDEVNFILVRKPKRGVLQRRIRGPLDIPQDGVLDPDVDDVNGEWEEISEGMNFTQLQINKNLIRYTHTGDMGKMQADNFRFKVTDGQNYSPDESFEIEIEHSQVSEIALLAKGMKVKEGQRVIISTDILSAEDGTDLFNRIKFNILHPPLFGQIESLNAPGKALKEFSQLDLAARRIVYVHTSRSESVEDWFKFKVSNGYQSKNGTLFIHIIPTDRITPTLLKNNVLFIKRGTERAISSTYLLVTDPDTRSTNLTFFIMKAPDHGELLNKGIKIIQKFTQDDVDTGRITYKNFGSQAVHDYFWFAVTDNKHIGFLVNGSLHLDPVKFTVALISLDPTPPIIVRNKQPTMLDSFERKKVGYIINSRFLKVTSSHEPAANLQFIITAKPKFGHLEDITRNKAIKKRFTQADLDGGRVAYIIDSKNKSVTYDSFMFKVFDSKRNELAPQRFGMSWPMIEFTRLEYIVCEDVGTLSVGLRRVGETSQSSYVSVSVREMSAKAGEDFGSQTAAQIQFDPGVKIVSWEIAIRDDGLPEGKEMFKLLLRSPVNAIIGEYDRATVKIINRNNAKRKCIEVPGMIHKGGIVPYNTHIRPSSVLKTEKETVYTFHGISGLRTDKKSSSRDENDDDEENDKFALDVSGNMKPLNDGTGAAAGSSSSGSTTPRSMKGNRKRGRKRNDRKKKNMTRKQKKIARFWERRDRMKKKLQKKLRQKGERVALRKKKKVDDDDDSEEVKGPKGKGSRRRKKEKVESSRRQQTPDSSTSWMYNGGKGASSLSTDTRKDSGRSSSFDRSSKSNRGSTGKSAIAKSDSGRGMTDDKMKEVFDSMDGRVVNADDRMSVDMPVVDQRRPRPLSDDSTVKKPGSHGYKNSKLSDDLEKGLLSSRKPSESDLAEGSGAAEETVYVNDCTPATKGMLHLDPATSLIYKCDGYDWLSLDDEFRALLKSTAPSTTTERPTAVKTVISASECLPGWLKSNGRCYKPFDELMTWTMAQKQCRQFGADLPSIWAIQQLDWLWRLIGQDKFWIGLNCQQTFRKWEYSNGDPVTFTYWRDEYPRGGPLSAKNCVLVREDKFWTNRPCNTLRSKFVCSKLPLSIHRTRN
ncbi:FRAS1-related extracellular matrix protein 1-like isoform X2 [Lineus longissimus]|uniref:FRAS1-related extracellular matrix protein 1-like isoform X2 n=1 Tax=Lineus longissimus TaxID=88925 RepID=UPI002B4FB4BF